MLYFLNCNTHTVDIWILCLCAGLLIVFTPVWLPCNTAYSGALHTRADQPCPGGAAAADRASGSGSVWQLRHTTRPGARQAGRPLSNCRRDERESAGAQPAQVCKVTQLDV